MTQQSNEITSESSSITNNIDKAGLLPLNKGTAKNEAKRTATYKRGQSLIVEHSLQQLPNKLLVEVGYKFLPYFQQALINMREDGYAELFFNALDQELYFISELSKSQTKKDSYDISVTLEKGNVSMKEVSKSNIIFFGSRQNAKLASTNLSLYDFIKIITYENQLANNYNKGLTQGSRIFNIAGLEDVRNSEITGADINTTRQIAEDLKKGDYSTSTVMDVEDRAITLNSDMSHITPQNEIAKEYIPMLWGCPLSVFFGLQQSGMSKGSADRVIWRASTRSFTMSWIQDPLIKFIELLDLEGYRDEEGKRKIRELVQIKELIGEEEAREAELNLKKGELAIKALNTVFFNGEKGAQVVNGQEIKEIITKILNN